MFAKLRNIWSYVERGAFFVGNIISGIILFIFYYTIFALFAIPFRLFGSSSVPDGNSSWESKSETPENMEYFKSE